MSRNIPDKLKVEEVIANLDNGTSGLKELRVKRGDGSEVVFLSSCGATVPPHQGMLIVFGKDKDDVIAQFRSWDDWRFTEYSKIRKRRTRRKI